MEDSTTVSELEKKKEFRKSWVRVVVTYAAMAFLFAGGPLLIIVFIVQDKSDIAFNVFNAILPVSAAIISYWFAGRSNKNSNG